MKATVIKIRCGEGEIPEEVPGWFVPDTDELLAVDLRYEANVETGEAADWYITHIPTGFMVHRHGYTNAASRERAVEVAQNFYRECRARGWDMTSSDADSILSAHNKMPWEEKLRFWNAVRATAAKAEPVT